MVIFRAGYWHMLAIPRGDVIEQGAQSARYPISSRTCRCNWRMC
ncbi:hypothetical protein SUDANB58_00211 [Streptomyces sp. enrichment culture]